VQLLLRSVASESRGPRYGIEECLARKYVCLHGLAT
jgi:hypothetical protein